MDFFIIKMHNATSFVIGSFNCRGFNASKKEFVSSVLSRVDLLMMQEHWLTDSQAASLADIDHSFLCSSISGFDNTEILSGRPYGGCAIFWRSEIKFNATLLNSNSRRVCAIRLISDSIKLLFVNVYMPYEDSVVNVDEFSDQLLIVEQLITNNPDCHVVVGGDFNVDFSEFARTLLCYAVSVIIWVFM